MCVCVSTPFILVEENPKLVSVSATLVDIHKQNFVAHWVLFLWLVCIWNCYFCGFEFLLEALTCNHNFPFMFYNKITFCAHTIKCSTIHSTLKHSLKHCSHKPNKTMYQKLYMHWMFASMLIQILQGVWSPETLNTSLTIVRCQEKKKHYNTLQHPAQLCHGVFTNNNMKSLKINWKLDEVILIKKKVSGNN